MILTEHFVYDTSLKEWNLYPFGDLQFGARGFRNDLWENFIKDVNTNQNSLTIGIGDYSDLFRPTIQGRFDIATSGDKDAAQQLEFLHKAHISKIAEKLSKVVSKKTCLGLLGGHHDMDYLAGITSTQYLCDMLGVKYLGKSCLIRLHFRPKNFINKKKHGSVFSIKIHAQHGSGGSTYISTDLGNLERRTAPYYNADIFIRGHSTKKGIIKVLEYDIGETHPPILIEKEKLLVNTGGFMSGYSEGSSASYVEKKNMPPSSLGWVKIGIRLVRHHSGFSKKYGISDREIKLNATLF